MAQLHGDYWLTVLDFCYQQNLKQNKQKLDSLLSMFKFCNGLFFLKHIFTNMVQNNKSKFNDFCNFILNKIKTDTKKYFNKLF